MGYHFNFSPKEKERIEFQDLYVEIPVYGDLLTTEYETLDKLDRAEGKWQADLFQMYNDLAKEKGLDAYELARQTDSLTEAPTEDQIAYYGESIVKIFNHLQNQPSFRDRVKNIALMVLRSRVSPNIAAEDLDVPFQFLVKINDFVYLEQNRGKRKPYAALEKEVEGLRIKTDKLDSLLKSAEFLASKVMEEHREREGNENIECKKFLDDLADYSLYFSDLGKPNTTDL